MKPFLQRWAFVLAVLVLLASASAAMAQQQAGAVESAMSRAFTRDYFVSSTFGLLLNVRVIEELELTEEQRNQIREIDKRLGVQRLTELLGKMSRDFQDADRAAAMTEMAKLRSIPGILQSNAELKTVLSAEQFARYQQLGKQRRGNAALTDSDVSGELQLTDEQLARLKTLNEEYSERSRVPVTLPPGTEERSKFISEMSAKMTELGQELDRKRLSILTEQQQQRWAQLKGPASKALTPLTPFVNSGSTSFSRGGGPPSSGGFVGRNGSGPASNAPTFFGTPFSVFMGRSAAEEFQLTDEQMTKLRQFSDKLREDPRLNDLRSKMQNASAEQQIELQVEREKLRLEQFELSAVEAKKILTAEQFARYRQLTLRYRGITALADNDVAGELKLNDEQLTKLRAIGEEMNKRARESLARQLEERVSGRTSNEDLRAKAEEFRQEIEAKSLAVLTDAQREQWAALNGPAPKAEPLRLSASDSGPAPATPRDPKSPEPSESEKAFWALDSNRDGKLSQAEWDRSRSTRRKFTDAGIEFETPIERARFLELYEQATKPK